MNKIIETINQIQSSWTKDQTIRFLYIKLAPYVKRDLVYFLSSDEDKYKEFQQGFINRFPNVVCSTLADFYVKVFNELGINSKHEIEEYGIDKFNDGNEMLAVHVGIKVIEY